MGVLPDDAKQDLKIMYLQEEVKYLKDVVKQLEIDNAKRTSHGKTTRRGH